MGGWVSFTIRSRPSISARLPPPPPPPPPPSASSSLFFLSSASRPSRASFSRWRRMSFASPVGGWVSGQVDRWVGELPSLFPPLRWFLPASFSSRQAAEAADSSCCWARTSLCRVTTCCLSNSRAAWVACSSCWRLFCLGGLIDVWVGGWVGGFFALTGGARDQWFGWCPRGSGRRP